MRGLPCRVRPHYNTRHLLNQQQEPHGNEADDHTPPAMRRTPPVIYFVQSFTKKSRGVIIGSYLPYHEYARRAALRRRYRNTLLRAFIWQSWRQSQVSHDWHCKTMCRSGVLHPCQARAAAQHPYHCLHWKFSLLRLL